MPIIDCYGFRKQQQVMEETWGHLRAKPGTEYRGWFIFAHDLEGMTVLLAFAFPSELEDSPWLHQDTHDFMEVIIDRELHGKKSCHEIRGVLWKFEGVYRVSDKGERRFVGKTRRIKPW